jgi:uncharacterized membrane protein
MNEFNLIVKKFAVSRWRLFLGTVIGFILYPFIMYAFYFITSGMWELISNAPVEPPVIDSMYSYGKPEQNGYWIFVWSAILSGIVLSALLPSFLGASLGKFLLKIRYVNEDGSDIRLRQTLMKTRFNSLLFLIVALPGPIIGFTIGEGSEYYSLAVLFLGLLIAVFLSVKADSSGRTLAYRKAHIVPIMKNDIEAFRKEIGVFRNR